MFKNLYDNITIVFIKRWHVLSILVEMAVVRIVSAKRAGKPLPRYAVVPTDRTYFGNHVQYRDAVGDSSRTGNIVE